MSNQMVAPIIHHRGLRHLALCVTDVQRATEFYTRLFGMRVAWQPDPDNAYLTSGCDNLALHRGDPGDRQHQALDHLGFVVATIDDVEAAWKLIQGSGIPVAKPLSRHRDGSVSFYIHDPDSNTIQILYEPGISPLSISAGNAAPK
jgi:catechol 2,3-dioxygenase-like lactoylglutathione lyase family enzyme